MPLSPLARRYDHLLVDLDGCVWVGDEPTPRAPEALAAVREAGLDLAFVTNDARHAPEDFVRKLWRLGFQASLAEVVTVGAALQHVLHEEHSGASAFVIGAPAVHRHVVGAGLRVVNGTTFASRAEVVVVAGHEGFDFDELRMATRAVLRGAALFATGRDRTFPMPDGPWPGTGPVVAAVETATRRPARSLGKPDGQLFRTALDRFGAGPDARALVIGDRIDADLAGAHDAGLDGAVVLSGATDAAAAAAASDPAPVAVADTLADLLLGAR